VAALEVFSILFLVLLFHAYNSPEDRRSALPTQKHKYLNETYLLRISYYGINNAAGQLLTEI
jgi:hypothetical protein